MACRGAADLAQLGRSLGLAGAEQRPANPVPLQYGQLLSGSHLGHVRLDCSEKLLQLVREACAGARKRQADACVVAPQATAHPCLSPRRSWRGSPCCSDNMERHCTCSHDPGVSVPIRRSRSCGTGQGGRESLHFPPFTAMDWGQRSVAGRKCRRPPITQRKGPQPRPGTGGGPAESSPARWGLAVAACCNCRH